jgi:signal transduction histidine kinase
MISNVVRHADARSASLSLLNEGETLVIAIRDNGRGFDRSAVPDSAVGLRSIEQRVADLDGSALIESSPGDGTTITATLPWPEDPGHADA